MHTLPNSALTMPIVLRLTTNSAIAQATIAASKDANTSGQSYNTGTGS